MLAVGLIEGPPDPVYRYQKLLMLPEDADVEDLMMRALFYSPLPIESHRAGPGL